MELHPIPKISIPWHTVHIDILGKLSGKSDRKEYVIVQIDAFTKFVFLYHTLMLDSQSCINALKASIYQFGVPNLVVADQGRSFTGAKFADFCSLQKINLHLIATGASRANGQVERVMSTLKSMLTAVETSSSSWQDSLGEVQLALNCTINRVTNSSPLELLIGKIARPLGLIPINDSETPIKISETRAQAENNMNRAAQEEKRRFDLNKAKIIKYKVGDNVLIKTDERNQTKLDAKFRGPFVVTEVLEGDRYTLKNITNKRLYKYPQESLKRFVTGQVPSELDDEEELSPTEAVETDKE